MAMELLAGFATAPGGTLTAVTMATGDSSTVRKSIRPKLLNVWEDAQGTGIGIVRIRSALFHDNANGIRLQATNSDVLPLMPFGLYQPLQGQDVLTIEDAATGDGAGDLETTVLMLHYDSLPGSEGRTLDESSLRSRAVQPLGVENTLALGVAGGWSGAEAINAETDVFKAEVDYALAGYVNDIEAAAIAWRGPDTGNLRYGGPGDDTAKHLTSQWFIRMSREYGLAMIPVVNAANKAATNIDGAQDENGADAVLSSIYIQMTAEAEKSGSETSAPTSSAPGRGGTPLAGRPLAIGERRVPLFGGRQVA